MKTKTQRVPTPGSRTLPEFLCPRCRWAKERGDGGEYMGKWEFYVLHCKKTGKSVDPEIEPDYDDETSDIIIECSAFQENEALNNDRPRGSRPLPAQRYSR